LTANVWIDVLTPKQALLFSTLIKEVDAQYLITTRKYDYTVDILKLNSVDFVTVHRYGGKGRYEKLRAGIKRMEKLAHLVKKSGVKLAVSFTSPEAARVAFGLSIPLALLTDSPHSLYVNKLTLPLADVVITPKCTAKGIERFIGPDTEIYAFDGIFEATWVKRFKPNERMLKNLGLRPYSYAIVRTEESKAAYYEWNRSEPTVLTPLIKALSEKLEVIVYVRYKDQYKYLKRALSAQIKSKRVKMLKRALNMMLLEYYAGLVITGGSSMAQESALIGTPSFTFFPQVLETFNYLKSKGFPIYFGLSFEELTELSLKIATNPKAYRANTKEALRELEDPVTFFIRIVNEYV